MTEPSQAGDDFVFEPVTAPQYTQVPDVLFDAWAPHLSEAELRVMLYVIRRTFGFRRDRDAISLSQLCEGIVTRDGRRLDYGTGMRRKAVSNACQGLVSKGLLSIEKHIGPDGNNEINIYALCVAEDQGVVSQRNQGGVPKKPPLVSEGNPQETVKTNSDKQGSLSKGTGNWKSAPGWIARFMSDFSTEFGDPTNMGSNTTRTWRLFEASGLADAQFSPLLYKARTITHQQPFTGYEDRGSNGMIRFNKMAYYFQVLEDLISETQGKPHREHPLHEITRERIDELREQMG